MPERATQPPTVQRAALAVRGVVQGVGFRPFVYNAARSCGLSGWVRNETDLVRIEVQGDRVSLDAFLETLRHKTPPQARIDSIDISEIEVVPSPDGRSSFEILPSRELAGRRPAIPADLATCAECLAEIRDPGARRSGYPFTNCTNCGPRWSIIEGLPYDRPRTSMRRFAMCAACRAEYESPADRRFHAQPIACADCGPELRLLDPTGGVLAGRDEALAAAAEAILDGKIVALKGLGGFQLLVDATRDEPVQRLRRRKRRPAKPLAVMVGSLDEVRRYCTVTDDEAAQLGSPAAPIVLLHRRESSGNEVTIAEAVAPGNPDLGVMLPYTPLHHLLMDRVGRPVVCTSGNLSEEPMAATTADALRRLGSIADVVLTHNRPIVRPVDDSVVRCDATGTVVLRRARGYAPLPIELGAPTSRQSEKGTGSVASRKVVLQQQSAAAVPVPFYDGPPECPRKKGDRHRRNDVTRTVAPVCATEPVPLFPSPASRPSSPVILAVGGHLKNTVALRLGHQVVVGSHVGDLDSPRSWEVHRRAVDDLVSFFDARPERIACDLHPDYLSTRHAERLAGEWGVPLVRVQHHHAHVAACVAEHGLVGPVLGLAWDGTGYGTNGTVWGGEALVCEGAAFWRVAHLRQFGLPGGDAAVRRPRRSALGALFEIAPELAEAQAGAWFGLARRQAILAMLQRGARCPRTSSMGRLFDAVAALCGLPDEAAGSGQQAAGRGTKDEGRRAKEGESAGVAGSKRSGGPVDDGDVVVSFEGEAAMALEFAADWDHDEAYPIELGDGEPAVANWGPVVRAVLADRAAGVTAGQISARFHNALAALAVEIARRAGCGQVALSGGCFQNRLLTERVRGALSRAGFNVYTHQKVPPGDGGIALGQAYLAGEPEYQEPIPESDLGVPGS